MQSVPQKIEQLERLEWKKMTSPLQLEPSNRDRWIHRFVLTFDKDIQSHHLVRTFLETNLLELENSNPGIELIKRVYPWISKESNCLTGEDKERLDGIGVLTKIRYWTERHFATFPDVIADSQRESEQVGAHLQRVEDDIRRRIQKIEQKNLNQGRSW